MIKYAELIENIATFEALATAYRTWGPYSRKSDGRQIIIVQDTETSKPRTVSYPKYLMEEKLNRRLDPNNETIDHWDSDFNNNDINNLRIVPRKEHSTLDTKRVKLVDLNCCECGKDFKRSPRLIRMRNKSNASGYYCSRECAGKHNRKRQLGKADKFPTPEYVDSEYYKLKYATNPEELDTYDLPEDFEPSGLYEDVLMHYGKQPPMSVLLRLLREHEIKAHQIGKYISVIDLGGVKNIIPANLKSVMSYLGY